MKVSVLLPVYRKQYVLLLTLGQLRVSVPRDLTAFLALLQWEPLGELLWSGIPLFLLDL